MDAVAGARRTSGRHKTGGVPPKPPATPLLSLWPLVFWDFGSLHQRRAVAGCRVFVHVAAATLASCRGTSQQNIPFLMSLQLQTLRRHVSRPVAAGVSLSLSGRRCGVTVCLQSRRRRWDCLVLLKDGHTSVRESLFLLVIVAGLVLSAPAALLPLIMRRHFRSPSAFDEFFLGSQRETTVLLR